MSSAVKLLNEYIEINYYSLNEDERHLALKKLADLGTLDAARELVQIYYNCQWRVTKLFIIRNIIKCSNQRTFEFLIDLCLDTDDIPLVEQVIKSLGILKNELARKFLIQFYLNGAEHFKPAIVLALTEARNRNLILKFATDLIIAYKNQRQYLTKNLIFALGELKCKEALKTLSEIVQTTEFKEIALSALMAIGKITRNIQDITCHEKKFSNEPFEKQIYQNVKNQVILRSNWTVEDYLQKIFEEKAYHEAMPLELNTFLEEDVKAGLDLFADHIKREAYLDVLSKLSFKSTINSYQKLNIDFTKSPDHQDNLRFLAFQASLACQYSDDYIDIINSFADKSSENWFHLVVSALPSAEQIFLNLFKSNEYKNLKTSEKIQVLNQFSNWALVYRLNTKKINWYIKQLENLFLSESHIEVQARIIRSFAQVSADNHKVDQFVQKNIFLDELIKSYLLYFERAPSETAIQSLEQFVENEKLSTKYSIATVKAIAAQNTKLLKNKNIEKYILTLSQFKNNANLQKHLLFLLAQLPFAGLKNFILESLKCDEPEIQLAAIVAIKSYQDEKSADDVAQLLNSEIDTIRGRSLDTLLSIPGLRARRLAFDYFLVNKDQPEIIEQVCRRFEIASNFPDYFYNKVEELIKKVPLHPQLEILNEFKEKLFNSLKAQKSLHEEKRDAEVLSIDMELSKKISGYNDYDETARSSLRSAELPFVHPEMYTSFVDKSVSILGYSKALDIILEKKLGRKILFPKLETKLYEFQNIIHLYELNDSNVSFERVIKNLSLEKYFNQQSFPLHKMYLIGQGILNAKIINEHFKILDGLRAWAIVLLLFCRQTNLVKKPLIYISDDDQLIVNFSKKLMWLQELRNPVAHRQTLSDFKAVEQARFEAIDILNSLNKLLK